MRFNYELYTYQENDILKDCKDKAMPIPKQQTMNTCKRQEDNIFYILNLDISSKRVLTAFVSNVNCENNLFHVF
jgi:hypothetical protein